MSVSCGNHVAGRRCSELKLHCELEIAWPSSPQIGVPAAYIRSRRDRDGADATAVTSGQRTVEKIDGKARQQGIAEVWVIENVEEIDSPLHGDRFPEAGILGYRKIELFE